MRSRFLNWPVLGIAAVVLSAALFAGGLLAGRSLESNDAPASGGTGDSVGNLLPRTGPFAGARDDGSNSLVRTAAPRSGGSDDMAATEDIARDGYGGYGGYGEMAIPPSYYGCEALLGDVIQGTSLDPAAAGITPKLLGPQFQLIRLSLWAEGECDEQGGATVGRPVLESSWRHTESGATVSISQRILTEPVANVRYETSASVVSDGYLFTVNAWNNYYFYEDTPVSDDAADILPPSDQQDVEAALTAALADIAPSVPSTCYYLQTEGDWSDLASLGIGDPRSAIPAGFTLSNFNLYTFAPPAAGCPDNGAEPPMGNSFWAQWTADNGRSYLEVNMYRNPYYGDEGDWPGNLDEWGANWTRNGTSFGVWGSDRDGGLGVEPIAAVATALDPQFSRQCLISLTPLDASALAQLGIGTPAADGFEVTQSTLNRRGIDPSCPGASRYEDYTSYEFNWTLESYKGELQAYAWVSGADYGGGERWGYIYDGGLEWGYGNRNFSIWGKVDGSEDLRELLVAVATSMDPAFDVDDLNEDGYPRPLPVEPDAGGTTGDSGSSSGVGAAQSSAP